MKRLAFVLLAACGTADGEPIAGTIAIDLGGEPVAPTVGAALPDDGQIFVLLGTRDISCETQLDDQLARGTYVSFVIAPEAGAQQPFVAVTRVVPGGTHINGGTGDVVIDDIADRITGSVTFSTVDPDEDLAIAATGTFDVLACF